MGVSSGKAAWLPLPEEDDEGENEDEDEEEPDPVPLPESMCVASVVLYSQKADLRSWMALKQSAPSIDEAKRRDRILQVSIMRRVLPNSQNKVLVEENVFALKQCSV